MAAGSTRTERLRRIWENRDPAALGAIARRGTGVERMEAIKALGGTASPDAEPYLLEVVAAGSDRFCVPLANAALATLGSRAAIPLLARLIHDPVENVKTSAIAALMKLGDPSLTPLLVDALSDRSWVAKWYAMAAIDQHGDERAIDPVCRRIRQIATRSRATKIGGWTELMYALDFLQRWRVESKVAAATLAWAAARADRFSDVERHWFRSVDPRTR